MSNIENKTENPSTKADGMKTGVVGNKKSLESLADQQVDGDNVLGGISVKFNNNRTSDDSESGHG